MVVVSTVVAAAASPAPIMGRSGVVVARRWNVCLVALVSIISALGLFGTGKAERFKEVFVYQPENDDTWQLGCSREKSRMVRRVLNDYVFPHLAKAKVNFTTSCPLARERDMYLEHEEHKQKFRASYWKSLYSNKIFKSEYFIDQHMENRHMDKIPKTADVCLAQYCDAFLCDQYAYRYYDVEDGRQRLKHRFVRKPCYENNLASAQDMCNHLLEGCFKDFVFWGEQAKGGLQGGGTGLGQKTHPLYNFFKSNVCDLLTCRTHHKLLSTLNSKRPNRFRVLYITFGVVAFLLLVSYYIVVFLSWMERKQKPDLIRRRNRKRD